MSTAPFHALLPLSRKSTGAILDKLTEELADPAGLGNSHRRIDNFPDAYMAAVVERIGADRYSVAHYFEQNGDRVADPDIEFVLAGGEWFPVAAQLANGSYYRVEDDQGQISRRTYNNIRELAVTLLRNIKEQQSIAVGPKAPSMRVQCLAGKARLLGRAAAAAGKERAPGLDDALRPLLEALDDHKPLLKAWLSGWDEVNVKRAHQAGLDEPDDDLGDAALEPELGDAAEPEPDDELGALEPSDDDEPDDDDDAGAVEPVLCETCGTVLDAPARHTAIGNLECPGGVDKFRPATAEEVATHRRRTQPPPGSAAFLGRTARQARAEREQKRAARARLRDQKRAQRMRPTFELVDDEPEPPPLERPPDMREDAMTWRELVLAALRDGPTRDEGTARVLEFHEVGGWIVAGGGFEPALQLDLTGRLTQRQVGDAIHQVVTQLVGANLVTHAGVRDGQPRYLPVDLAAAREHEARRLSVVILKDIIPAWIGSVPLKRRKRFALKVAKNRPKVLNIVRAALLKWLAANDAENVSAGERPDDDAGILRGKDTALLEEIAPAVLSQAAFVNAREHSDASVARLELERAFKRELARRFGSTDVNRWVELSDRFYGDAAYRRAILDFLWARSEGTMHTEGTKTCCKACAAGRDCEKTCPSQPPAASKTLVEVLAGPRVIRDFGAVKLVLVPGSIKHDDKRDVPRLQVRTEGGDLLFSFHRSRDQLRLSATGKRMLLPGARGTTFDIFGEDRRDSDLGEPGDRRLVHWYVTRGDDRAVTRTQQSHASDLLDHAQELAQPLLHVLQEAYEWVEAEARVEEIDATLEHLAEERRALTAKLGGPRPW